MAKDEIATEKGPEMTPGKSTGAKDETGDTTPSGLWVCPWCGKDCHSERNYYYHIKKCDSCPEDKIPDKDRPSVSEMKREEPFIINIFGDTGENEGAQEAETAPSMPPSSPPAAYEEAPYLCGYCGAGMRKKHKHCPDCGQALEWAPG
jgi:hypothetical protein